MAQFDRDVGTRGTTANEAWYAGTAFRWIVGILVLLVLLWLLFLVF